MAPDVSFTTASLEYLVDDGSTELSDYSSVSSDDIHIGLSSRPQMPLILSNSSVSKSLPSRWPGGVVPRRIGPPPRSQSARPHQTSDHQRASTCSPRPSPYQPPHTPLHPQPRPPSVPPRPPPPPPPRPPPLVQSASQTLLRPLDSHGRQHSGLVKPEYGYGVRGDDGDYESFSSSSGVSNGPDIGARRESDYLQHLTENYVALQGQRSALSGMCKEAKTHRAHVQSLRQNEAQANQKFMMAMRASLPAKQFQHLHQLFKVIQDSRLECQKAEQRLDETIDEWHRCQEDLGWREETFYDTAKRSLGVALLNNHNNHNDDRKGHSEDSGDWALRGISGDRPETFHPLYEKLRVAFGELQLARELLTNTQMKRERLHARKTPVLPEGSLDLLETYGEAGRKKAVELRAMSHMTEEDVEQLREYDELEQDAKQDIKTYSAKVMVLQRECRENGVLPPSSYFQQEGFGGDSFYGDEIRLAPGPFESHDEAATLAHPVFPHLLSNPTHLLHGFPQTALQSLKMAIQLPLNAPVRAKKMKEAAHEVNMHALLSSFKSEDKSDYINRWLLHKLHHSALEAELLWTTFRSKLTILDIDRWQRDVLRFWWNDKPADFASIDFGDNYTDNTASAFAGSYTEFNKLPHSDSGQLDCLRTWDLDDSWP